MEGIFEKLGFTRENGLFITSENEWQEVFSKRVEEFFESKIKPYAFFCISDKPLILFYKNLGDEYKKEGLKKKVFMLLSLTKKDFGIKQ